MKKDGDPVHLDLTTKIGNAVNGCANRALRGKDDIPIGDFFEKV